MVTGRPGNRGSEGWGSLRSPEGRARAPRRSQSRIPPRFYPEEQKKERNQSMTTIKTMSNVLDRLRHGRWPSS